MEILRVLFLFVILGSGIVFLVRRLSVSQFLAPLIVVIGITLALYVFALAGWLQPGVLVISVLLLLMGIFSFFKWPFKRPLPKWSFSPALVAWSITFLLSAIFTAGMLFARWDEYSYWGVIYRYLMSVNHLPDTTSHLLVMNYPPFTALFQYFVGQIAGFTESNAFLGIAILDFSAIISLIPVRRWDEWVKYAIVLLLCIVSVFIFDFNFMALQVDLTLGLFFGAGLAIAALHKGPPLERLITLALIVAALTLTKVLGVFFGLICIAILYVSIAAGELNRNPGARKIKLFLGALIKPQVLIPLGVVLIVSMSWSTHIKPFVNTKISLSVASQGSDYSNPSPENIDAYMLSLEEQDAHWRLMSYMYDQPPLIKISAADLVSTFSGTAPYRTKLAIQNFIKNLSQSKYTTSKLAPFQIILIILIVTFVIQAVIPRKQQQTSGLIRNSIILSIGLVVYCLALFFAFIYYFAPVEGSSAPSLFRYMGTFALGWWLLVLSTLARYETIEIPLLKQRTLNFLPLLLLLVVVSKTPFNKYFHLPSTPDSRRVQIAATYDAIESKLGPGDKIYNVWQVNSSSGFTFYITKYFLTPLPSNNYGWRLGQKESPGDIYTAEFTPEEWFNLLTAQKYTYVLVSSSDQAFWDTYGDLFDTYNPDNVPQFFAVTSSGLEKVDMQLPAAYLP